MAVGSRQQQGLVLAVAQAAAVDAGRTMRLARRVEVKTKANAKDLVTATDAECQRIVEASIRASFPDHAFLGEEDVPPGPQGAALALASVAEEEWAWIVDPIDGTTNFASDLALSCVSIGVVRRGERVGGVVHDPYRDETFVAWRGEGATLNGRPISVSAAPTLEQAVVCAPSPNQPSSMGPALRSIAALMPRVRSVRVLGSGVLAFAWVACGRLSAYYEHELASWDCAAGTLLVQEAGGAVSHTDGSEYSLRTRAVLASNGIVHDELVGLLAEAGASRRDPDP